MGEINSAQYSSVFPRFLLSLGFHPLGEDAKSCESPWLLVETAFFTPLSVDLGLEHDCEVAATFGQPESARRLDRNAQFAVLYSKGRGGIARNVLCARFSKLAGAAIHGEGGLW